MIDVPVQIKDALRDGRLTKNYRFVVLNEDGTESEIGTIDNNNLVSESVSIDERMCSGDTLKFGLCEGSSLEFQYFGLPNITGKRVQAFIDADYGEAEPYTIPMGFFDVKKCSRQASTGIIKVTAYNKLQSDYLDQKANGLLIEAYSSPELQYATKTLDNIMSIALGDFKIKNAVYNDIYISSDMHAGKEHEDYQANFMIYDANHQFTGKYLQSAFSCVEFGVTAPDKYKHPDYNFWVAPGTWQFNIANIETFWEDVENYLDEIVEEYELQDSYLYTYTGSQSYYLPIKEYIIRYAKKELYESRACRIHMWQSGNYAIEKLISLANDLPYLSDISTGASDYSNPETFVEVLYIPSLFRVSETAAAFDAGDWSWDAKPRAQRFLADANYKMYKMVQSEIGNTVYTKAEIEALPDFTLRDIQSSIYETECQFGQLSRLTDLFSGVELNRSALYPADTLYPANSLYPDGAQESSFRSQYSKLWADEGNVHKWRNLIITYKGLDENQQPKDFTLQRQVNADGTDDYNCSDNWLFRNLIWTSEQIAQYAEAMVAKMQPITWFPFEMWAAGLPYLETGDQIEIPLGEETYTSYILQRNLKGIQNLQDTYINGTLDIF